MLSEKYPFEPGGVISMTESVCAVDSDLTCHSYYRTISIGVYM